MSRLAATAVGAALLVVLTGCAGLADAPPDEGPPPPLAVRKIDRSVILAASQPVPMLISQGLRRKAQLMVVRVRNVSCQGVGTGSGFALDRDTLLTNRHVLAGADRVEVSTWDGRSLKVSTAEVGALVDMGIAEVEGRLPPVATSYAPAVAGAPIAVVGFPLGGPLTFSNGRVLDLVDGARFGIPGRVMRITAIVEPGSSGSPVLNAEGKVVGIVYAIELATGLGLAIPLDTVRTLVDRGGLQGIPACGSR